MAPYAIIWQYTIVKYATTLYDVFILHETLMLHTKMTQDFTLWWELLFDYVTYFGALQM